MTEHVHEQRIFGQYACVLLVPATLILIQHRLYVV